MTRKRLPRVFEDDPIWERQPWDTERSYTAFFLYYFPQEIPRSLNAAYRKYNPKRKRPDAPSNWRRWFRGEDSKDNQKYYRQIGRDGSISVFPVPGWEKRAATWDESIRSSILENTRKEQEQFITEMQLTVKGAWALLMETWIKFKPSDDYKLGELTQATRTLAATIDQVYGGILSGEEGKETPGQSGELSPELTDLDRVEAAGELFLKAMKRKQEAGEEDDPNPA